jgi:CheY-like chemotaxis protein
MDGLEATAAIRNKERVTGRRIPVVAMTAYALKGDQERCLAAGMDGYLTKPVRFDDLLKAIERFAPSFTGTTEECLDDVETPRIDTSPKLLVER